MSHTYIFLVTIIIICYNYSIFFILGVNASSENSLIDNLLNTANNTLDTITGGISDSPKYLEYTIDIDPKEVFPNQTIKERILNKFDPTKYFIPTLDYNLLGFNISATNIRIQTDSTQIQDNKTIIEFPIMMADNVKINNRLTDMSFDSVDLSSIYIILPFILFMIKR